MVLMSGSDNGDDDGDVNHCLVEDIEKYDNDIDDADDKKEEEDVDEFVCLSVCWVRGEH